MHATPLLSSISAALLLGAAGGDEQRERLSGLASGELGARSPCRGRGRMVPGRLRPGA